MIIYCSILQNMEKLEIVFNSQQRGLQYSADIKNDTVDISLSTWKDVYNIFQRKKKQITKCMLRMIPFAKG